MNFCGKRDEGRPFWTIEYLKPCSLAVVGNLKCVSIKRHMQKDVSFLCTLYLILGLSFPYTVKALDVE